MSNTLFRTYHTACWKKTAKGQTQPNSKLTSGPKYCDGDQTTASPGGETDSIRVMSYNLYGWNALVKNSWKAKNIYKSIKEVNPDLLGAQECEGKEHKVAAALGSDYAVAGAATAGHAVFYRKSVFTYEGHGVVNLHEQDKWGPVTYRNCFFMNVKLASVANCGVCPIHSQAFREKSGPLQHPSLSL